jgi:Ran GTPase-activating protein (RanGAP) involved in mRNA processing and transport
MRVPVLAAEAELLCAAIEDPDPQRQGRLPAWEVMNLAGNPLKGSGLWSLATALPAAQASLQSVNLAGIGVTDADIMAVQLLAEAIVACPKLQVLDFNCNHIGACTGCIDVSH